MTRVKLLAIAFTALMLEGCVAPEVCSQVASTETLQSETLTQAAVFAGAGEGDAVRLRATLRGLSELWPAEYTLGGALAVTLHLTYVDPIDSGGGATQMPQFSVALRSEASPPSPPGATPSFPAATGTRLGLTLFQECWEGDTLDCCEYGATECSASALLEYQRLDGAPFPPVELAWEATASANASTCPLSENTELLLELEEP